MNRRKILVQRAAPAPGKPLDAFAKVGDGRQAIRPQIIDGAQRNQPLQFGGDGSFASYNRLPALLDFLPLALDDALIFLQKAPDFDILPLGDALNALDIVTFSAIFH